MITTVIINDHRFYDEYIPEGWKFTKRIMYINKTNMSLEVCYKTWFGKLITAWVWDGRFIITEKVIVDCAGEGK